MVGPLQAPKKASKAKDDFLALLSHELRTPLTPALAAASYLAEHEDLLPEFREEVTAIWSNVQLEARLIDDLLDLTRITCGKIELRREAVDAHRLLRDAIQISQKDMLEKQIELVMELNATVDCAKGALNSAGSVESNQQCGEVYKPRRPHHDSVVQRRSASCARNR